ncbi:MAG: HsdR family type I site-specific deoxyribonuclease [Acidobacteria bacterium]|nr:HsdR family type I site-specific deoxyribonuclease [Acidobacteriota bacterium]
MTFTEYKTVEKEILDCLQTKELGWQYEPGDDVNAKYRGGDEQEMLLIPILRRKLKELNPGVITDDERANIIIQKLRALKDNQEWIQWLRGEKTYKFSQEEPSRNIHLIDYTEPSKNDFLATNQLWIQGIERRRPDILLFINGIPVVDIEAKTASHGHVDWAEGAKQTARYDREVPNLYYSNCFCAGVNELRMKYGIPGARLQYWQQWRDPYPHTQIPSFDEMKCTTYGLFDRGNLLDMIQNFIVFETEQGQLVKKIARYQQFRAANKIVGRALEIDKASGQRRGIVWHTQGSGKSLTMLFAARKLWNDPSLEQPTIIIVVDREQLQDQMVGELFKANSENVAVATSIRDMRRLIGEGDGYRGIIVTIVNKFDGMEQELSKRPNIIMLVDEAHRTQYGDLGVFMRSAMPNASLFGLTGTPLELDDLNTPRAFGKQLDTDRYERYMDRYSIEDSLRDGATKPIHYEIRMTDWTVAYADLDKKFEALFADRSPEERKLLMGEAKLDAILKHPKRIAQIADDIARHFVDHIRPNGFKAMIVCRDKDTCALYKAALDQLLAPEVSLIIISEDPAHDVDSVKPYYLGDAQRRKAIEDFKKPAPKTQEERDNPDNRFKRVEILIVCDMLLTGFDAPILQAMYLDKGMRDHTLLQAIARVNRPYDDLKEYGLILDYFGIFENLNDALNYDKSELGEVAFPFQRFHEMFTDYMGQILDLFTGIPRDGSHQSGMQALIMFNDDDEKREEFERLFRNVRILFETLQPDDFLRSYLQDYSWLCKFYMLYRKKFHPKDHFEITEEDGAKTRQLIREHVDVKEIEDEFPTYKLDENYLTKIKDMNPDAKALDIEAMLDAEIGIRLDEDEDIRPLSERLKRIIEQKRAGTLAGIALLKELEDLTKQVVDVVQEAQRPIVDSIAKEVAKRVDGISEADAMAVAKAIVAKATEKCFKNWFLQNHMDTELYREFTILLATQFKERQLHGAGKDFVDRCIRLLKKVRFTADEQNVEYQA